MRKNEIVTICDLNEYGVMIACSPKYKNPELAPLGFAAYSDHISRWWRNRQIPIRQGRVEEMLRAKGFDEPSEYLLRNLGLSLTDYYWLKPIDSSLRWRDVNLFENDFRDNLLTDGVKGHTNRSVDALTPNSSLRGELEKSWVIRNGKRTLVKGNHGRLSSESINEVIATEFHKAQGYENHTKYRLLRIKNKPYDYGCYSEAFTDARHELVSAYELLTSEPDDGTRTSYERLISIAERHGIDGNDLRADLEYQILSDYVLSNTDRHMDNIGFIRDSETLRLTRMAPIFDTGKAFGGGLVIPYTEEEIDSIEVNSFENTEAGLMKLVTDRNALDVSKVLPPERIRALYEKDSKIRPGQIDLIVRLYNIKIERLQLNSHLTRVWH